MKQPPLCKRCNKEYSVYYFKAPYLEFGEVVSLCITCYRLLNQKEPDKEKQKELIEKYK